MDCYYSDDDKCAGRTRKRSVWGINNLWIWFDLKLCDHHYNKLPLWARSE